MFKESLEAVVNGTEGALAGLLMDFQGVAVESYAREGASVDVDVIGAEFSVIVKSVQRATESLEAGGARELAVTSDRLVTLIRVINDDYFVAIALEPTGNIGKGRYLLRTAAPTLLAELS